MLDGLVLAAVSEAVLQIVDRLLRVLILIDQAVCEVSARRRVRRVLLIWDPCARKVGVQDAERVLAVASVDQAERRRGVESVPVLGLGDPCEVVLQERVVRGVCVLDCVGPHGCVVED